MATKTEFSVTFNFKTDRFEMYDLNEQHVTTLNATNYVDAIDEARDIVLINQWEIDNADIGSEFDE